jgi:hypothetical protein
MKLRRARWAAHLARMRENMYIGKEPLGRARGIREDNVKMTLEK